MPIRNPLAVQLYTFRDTPAADRPVLLHALAAAGYGAVEPFGDPAEAPALRAELDEAGLLVCSLHGHPERHGLERVAGAARALGTDTIVIPSLDREGWGDLGNVRRLAAQVNEWGRQAAAEGLRIAYHNHYFEMVDLGGRSALEVFAGALDPGILLEVDTYWAMVGGQDVVALLRHLGDRVRYLHLKDGPADDKAAPMTAVGSGAMPIAEVLAANPAVEWNVVELDSCATDVLVAARESAAWLREHGFAGAAR
ncbi:MAG: sugar phosphate isomerase/epimerase family protein [Candidatus Dormibacteraceae bacterium]